MKRPAYIITGLPRSRTAWCAAYLSHGRHACLHDALAGGPEGARRALGAARSAVLGLSDPAALFFWKTLDEDNPKWILIERPYADAAASAARCDLGPSVMRSHALRLAEFKATHPDAAIIPFAELTAHRLKAALPQTDPPFDSPPERDTLMDSLNIQRPAAAVRRDIAALMAEPTRIEALRAQVEPSAAQLEFAALCRRLCAGHPEALDFLDGFCEAANLMDHIHDGDPMDRARSERAVETLTLQWPLNGFIRAHALSLAPVMANALSAWRHSNRHRDERPRAFDVYSEVPLAVAWCLGGADAVTRLGPDFRRVARELRATDDQRDRKE